MISPPKSRTKKTTTRMTKIPLASAGASAPNATAIRKARAASSAGVDITIRTYRCQGLTPARTRCGRYAEFEERGLWLCGCCHNKISRALASRFESQAKFNLEGTPLMDVLRRGSRYRNISQTNHHRAWRAMARQGVARQGKGPGATAPAH